jgi:branched-chain amino acid aminotransferase
MTTPAYHGDTELATRHSATPDTATPTSAAPWTVRPAADEDVAAVAVAVRELLLELGGTPGSTQAMRQAARAIVEDPQAGTVLVAQAQEGIVGVLAASWQLAIHVPGAYALIQDLWVHPAWRSRRVGASLLQALLALARTKQLVRVEVGLPRESFERFAATEAFYLANGFAPNGPRMRRGV